MQLHHGTQQPHALISSRPLRSKQHVFLQDNSTLARVAFRNCHFLRRRKKASVTMMQRLKRVKLFRKALDCYYRMHDPGKG